MEIDGIILKIFFNRESLKSEIFRGSPNQVEVIAELQFLFEQARPITP